MLGLHSVWMTGTSYKSLCWRNSFAGLHPTISGIWTRICPLVLTNGRWFHVKTGTWVSATILAEIKGNMESAVNVEASTGPKNLRSVE